MDVIVLPSNRPPDRFYRGGRKITDFQGEPPTVTASRRTGSHRQRRLQASNHSVSRSARRSVSESCDRRAA